MRKFPIVVGKALFTFLLPISLFAQRQDDGFILKRCKVYETFGNLVLEKNLPPFIQVNPRFGVPLMIELSHLDFARSARVLGLRGQYVRADIAILSDIGAGKYRGELLNAQLAVEPPVFLAKGPAQPMEKKDSNYKCSSK